MDPHKKDEPPYRRLQDAIKDPMNLERILVTAFDLDRLNTREACDDFINKIMHVRNSYIRKTMEAAALVKEFTDQRVLDIQARKAWLQDQLKNQSREGQVPKPVQLAVVRNRIPSNDEILREVFKENDLKRRTLGYLRNGGKPVLSAKNLRSPARRALCPHLGKQEWDETWRGFMVWAESQGYIAKYLPEETWNGEPSKNPKSQRKCRTWIGPGPNFATRGIPDWWSEQPPSTPA